MKLLIIDSNSIVNRAFYGIKLLSTKDGQFTNAIYGFFNITQRLIDDIAPDRVVFSFDLRAPTFRHNMYDGYKAQRKGMPEELASQMPFVKEIITTMGYPIVELAGYEADDILGTIAKTAEKDGNETLIATGDRDALQLVSDKVTVVLATTRVGGAEYLMMTPQAVTEKYGVEPCQLIETKALMGDASDNIPGVKGIGEKTAFALIQKYGTVANLYDNIDSIEATPSVKKKLTEGKEMAELSRQLGEICTEVPFGDYMEITQSKERDSDKLYTIFARLELHALIKRFALSPPQHPVFTATEEPAETYTIAKTGEQIPTNAKSLYISASVENSNIKELAVVAEDNKIYYMQEPTAEQIAEILTADCEKWVADSKPLHKVIMAQGSEMVNVRFDCALAGYLLSPNSTQYTVDRLAGEYGIATPIVEGDSNELINQTALLPQLCKKLDEDIVSNGQTTLLHDVEIPLSQVLASMELIGFRIDIEKLKLFGEEVGTLAKAMEKDIYELAGVEFNINSPKQMGVVLFEEMGLPTRKKTKSGYSTDAETLESLEGHHPIIRKILDYRRYSKLKSTYVEGLIKVTGEDNIIRSSFNQTETRTGRISSTEPNLQNIPIRTEPGNRMRSFFVAREGNVLVDADYSQIELRVLAAIASDENMIDAFLSGEDIHTNTASQVFDMPPLFVTPLMRSRAKAVNFGIVYGISAFSLAKDIGVTMSEADKYIKDYLKTYGGVKNYMDTVVAQATENGFVTTLMGRRRYIPELKSSNHNLRGFGKRVAMNMPIQGTAADIIKVAMVNVYRELKAQKLDAKLILQVHDELIVEAPPHEAEQVRVLVKKAMEAAIKLAVPMQVDIKTGKDWGETH